MIAPKKFGFIHITQKGFVHEESLCSFVIVNAGLISLADKGSFKEAALACGNLHTVLALPVHDLVITKLSLPTKNQNQRRVAIPFAIQKQLATDAKDMVWNWHARGKELDLVGIQNDYRNQLIESFAKLQFHPSFVVADALHLGGLSNHWQLMILEDQMLMQLERHQGMSVAHHEPILFLEKAFQEAQKSAAGAPTNISIYGHIDDPLANWLTEKNIAYQTIQDAPLNAHSFNSAAVLAHHYSPKTSINLLKQQGQTKASLPSIDWKIWRLPYVLAVLLGLTGIVSLWLDNIATENNIESTYQNGLTTFKNTLPNERIIDPVAQLQDKVVRAKLQKDEAQFLAMLSAFANYKASIDTEKTSLVSQIEFSKNQLHIHLTGPSGLFELWPKNGQLSDRYSYQSKQIFNKDGNNAQWQISISKKGEG